jgi:hypothetical protein
MLKRLLRSNQIMKKGRKRKSGWVNIYDVAREPGSKRWSLIHDTNSADLEL